MPVRSTFGNAESSCLDRLLVLAADVDDRQDPVVVVQQRREGGDGVEGAAVLLEDLAVVGGDPVPGIGPRTATLRPAATVPSSPRSRRPAPDAGPAGRYAAGRGRVKIRCRRPGSDRVVGEFAASSQSSRRRRRGNRICEVAPNPARTRRSPRGRGCPQADRPIHRSSGGAAAEPRLRATVGSWTRSGPGSTCARTCSPTASRTRSCAASAAAAISRRSDRGSTCVDRRPTTLRPTPPGRAGRAAPAGGRHRREPRLGRGGARPAAVGGPPRPRARHPRPTIGRAAQRDPAPARRRPGTRRGGARRRAARHLRRADARRSRPGARVRGRARPDGRGTEPRPADARRAGGGGRRAGRTGGTTPPPGAWSRSPTGGPRAPARPGAGSRSGGRGCRRRRCSTG